MEATQSILVIDDDLSVRQSLAFFFEDRGFNVLSAEDGSQGIEMFSRHKVDIVLTDLRMPKMDGIEVMKTIRTKNPDTPMIVISGLGEKEDIINAMRIGAKDYITKPLTDFDMVAHTVDRSLEISRLNRENQEYRKYIEKSEKLYRTITENIAEGVISLDNKGNITYANLAFCRMTGYTQDEVLQKNLKDLKAPDSPESVEEQFCGSEAEATARFEIKIMNKSGTPLHVELHCRTIIEGKKCQGSTVVVRDITYLTELREKYKDYVRHKENKKENVVPICANCKNIRVEKGKWLSVEDYFKTIEFSHGICKECCNKLYPDLNISEEDIAD